MKAPLVYVCAPYADGAVVRTMVHPALRERGFLPTSSWADEAFGPEDFARFSPSALRSACARNDADLRGSDIVLVLARHGAGSEMFAEARIASEWGKPLVWVGRRTLSAWRSGVVLVESLDDAFDTLERMKTPWVEGYRGLLLAQIAGGAA